MESEAKHTGLIKTYYIEYLIFLKQFLIIDYRFIQSFVGCIFSKLLIFFDKYKTKSNIFDFINMI